MNKFKWYNAQSLSEASQKNNKTLSEELYNPSGKAAIYKSGGIDVLDLMKEGLLEPDLVINLKSIPGMGEVEMDEDKLLIGANVTLGEIESSQLIKENFPAFHDAVAHAATPQLRNLSTIAGNLAQRTRCWYFRSAEHPCFRKGGDRCYARHSTSGQNENHAIFDNGTCVSVYASSIATVLLAYRAEVIISRKGKDLIVPLNEFFVSPGEDVSMENILQPGDIITSVQLAKPLPGTKTFYHKQGERESYDWSIADVAIVANMDKDKVEDITIVLGSAAPVPYLVSEANNLLKNKKINEKRAREVAKSILSKARPLSRNAYKVPLFESIITNGLLNLA